MPAQELSTGTAADRRISPRHPCSLTVLTRGDLCPARVYNLSGEGIGFFLGHELATDSHVGLEMLNPVASYWHLKGARVVHATLQPNGTWLIGAAFLHKLTDTDLQGLLKD